jgi:bifunctional DNA-binding transcriptional regulator/antitoxin component of YhaV-PrlF toxin-antitoxin module
MKEARITVEVKDDLKIYVPKNTLRAINAKKGDWIDVIVMKEK